VVVNNGGTLAGAFAVGVPGASQAITVHAGGVLQPGNAVGSAQGPIGTINASVLNLDAGAILSLHLQDAPHVWDTLAILDGGTLNLGVSSAAAPILVDLWDSAGSGTSAFAHNGTFGVFANVDVLSTDGLGNLSHVAGADFVGGTPASGVLRNFQVRNLPAPGVASFSLGAPGTASSIILTISGYTNASTWTGGGLATGDWNDAGNWSPTIPQYSGDAAVFGGGGGTISLNGSRKIGAVTLGGAGYYLAPGTGGKLFMDNGQANAAITSDGMQVVAVGIQLESATTITANSGTLTMAGAVGSAGASLTIAGAGRVVVTADGAHTGVTTVNGKLQLGAGGATGSLGSGAVVNNGSVVVNRSGASTFANPLSGSGTLTNAFGGTTTFTAAYLATGPVHVDAGQLVVAATGAARNTRNAVLTFGTLSVASGATLDITNHDAVIGNMTLHDVEQLILAGWGTATPGSPAMTSSTARTLGTTFLVPVTADDWLGNGTAGSGVGKTWDGYTIDQPNSVLVRYAFVGDLNLDGAVNGADFSIAASHVGQITPGLNSFSAAWRMGDVTLDGKVDGLDLATMSYNASSVMGMSLADFDGVAHGVPEPGTLLLVTPAVALLWRRRRWQRTPQPA